MRKVIKKFDVYEYQELTEEAKEKVKKEFCIDNSYGDWILQDRLKTLKEFTKYIQGKLDYSISLVRGQGDYITINNYSESLVKKAMTLNNCPFTGCCYDDDLIEYLKQTKGNVQSSLNMFLDNLYEEYISLFQEDYLQEHCEANNYEFLEDGTLYL